MTTPTPSQQVASEQFANHLRFPNTYRAPTDDEWLQEVQQLKGELAAARAELARERAERAEQKLADERAMHGLTLSRAERAEARAEANAKDAERYRWLRDESWKGINGTFAARWCLVANRGAGLDAAIDAIAEGKKP